MIKKSTLFLLFLILGILTTTFLLFLSYEWEIPRDTLYLKDSRIVVSEKTSEGENLVYYQQDGLTKVLPREEVEHIGYGDAGQTTSGEAFLSCPDTKPVFGVSKRKLSLVAPPYFCSSRLPHCTEVPIHPQKETGRNNLKPKNSTGIYCSCPEKKGGGSGYFRHNKNCEILP